MKVQIFNKPLKSMIVTCCDLWSNQKSLLEYKNGFNYCYSILCSNIPTEASFECFLTLKWSWPLETSKFESVLEKGLKIEFNRRPRSILAEFLTTKFLFAIGDNVSDKKNLYLVWIYILSILYIPVKLCHLCPWTNKELKKYQWKNRETWKSI